MACLLLLLLYCLLASGNSDLSLPPVSTDQAQVLKNVGLQLREELHLSRLLRTRQRLGYVLMVSGLSRGCHSSEYMEALFGSLCPKVGVIVFGLQFDQRTAKSKHDAFSLIACKKNIEASMLNHTECDVLFFSLQFLVVNRPCSVRHRIGWGNSTLSLAYNSTGSVKDNSDESQIDMEIPGRVHMSSLNIGRSWDWFNHYYKASAQSGANYHIRARLDDAQICVPNITTLPTEQIDWMAFNNIHNRTYSNPSLNPERRYYPSDRFAMMPEKLAYLYFEAWRIWLPDINCRHNVYASRAIVKSSKRDRHSTGEQVLDARLENTRAFQWYRTQRHVGNGLVRAVNETHCCVTMLSECRPWQIKTYTKVGDAIRKRNGEKKQCKINKGNFLK